jgi:hypothetical protein
VTAAASAPSTDVAVGQRFGKLIVIGFTPKGVKVRCDCGAIRPLLVKSLTDAVHPRRSCGCDVVRPGRGRRPVRRGGTALVALACGCVTQFEGLLPYVGDRVLCLACATRVVVVEVVPDVGCAARG